MRGLTVAVSKHAWGTHRSDSPSGDLGLTNADRYSRVILNFSKFPFYRIRGPVFILGISPVIDTAEKLATRPYSAILCL